MATPFLSSEEYDERAHQLYNEGQYDEALSVLREGLTLYPNSVELHVGVGYAQLAREEYAWARRSFEQALVLEPEHEDGLAGLERHHRVIFVHIVRCGNIDDVHVRIGSQFAIAAIAVRDVEFIAEGVGVFLGALAGALFSGDFKILLDKGKTMSVRTRLITSFVGGVTIGFASRLARGCTSGVALTGGAQLALSGWIFVISMFAAGFIVAAFYRRLWS